MVNKLINQVICSFGLIFLLPKYNFAQLPKQPITYEVVMEIELAEKMKNAVWEYDEHNLGENSLSKANAQENLIPQVAVYENVVKFYDEKKELIKIIPYDGSIKISPDNNHIGIGSYNKSNVNPEEVKEYSRRLEVFNKKGELVWKKDEILGDGNIVISGEAKTYVDVYYGRAFYYFYDSLGNKSKEVDIFTDDKRQFEKAYLASFSINNEFFAAVQEKWAGMFFDTDGEYTHKTIHGDYITYSGTENLYLIFFDKLGTELWRKTLAGIGVGCKLIFSNNSKYLAFDHTEYLSGKGFQRGVQLFDINGNLIQHFSALKEKDYAPWNPKIQFAKDDNMLLIANANWILMINPATGNILWKYRFDWKTDTAKRGPLKIIHAAKISPDSELILIEAGGERRWAHGWEVYNPELILFDKSGTIVWRQVFPGTGDIVGKDKASLQITDNGKNIIFYHNSRVKKLSRINN